MKSQYFKTKEDLKGYLDRCPEGVIYIPVHKSLAYDIIQEVFTTPKGSFTITGGLVSVEEHRVEVEPTFTKSN